MFGVLHWLGSLFDGHADFRLGYLTALDDIERTGLHPLNEAEKERQAERAWKRYEGA